MGIKEKFILLSDCFRIMEKRDLWKLAVVSAINTALALLDVVAVGALGVLGSLTVFGIQSTPPIGVVGHLLSFFGLDGFSFQIQATIIGAFSCIVLLIKTALSALLAFRVARFLANRGAKYSSKLIGILLNGSLNEVRRFSSQENIYILTQGINLIVSGVIGATINLLAESVLTMFLMFGLFLFEPWLGFGTLLYFGTIGAILFLMLQKRISRLARKEAELNIHGNEMIVEAVSLFKELRVRNRQSYYIDVLSKSRYQIAKTQAELGVIPNVTKYVIEIALVVGAISLSAFSFAMYDASKATAILSIFLVTSSRIAPAVLRMQTGIGSIRQNLASSRITLNFMEHFQFSSSSLTNFNKSFRRQHDGFVPQIRMQKVEFGFGRNQELLKFSSLEINEGSIIGISGKSGVGKTTLVDIILGLRAPKRGLVQISGLSPNQAIQKWPGAISYVSQETFLVNGTIFDNICLGYDKEEVSQQDLEKCLLAADLNELIEKRQNGIHSLVGERGNLLSGGQRQKIGIARSLLTHPRLIILDEATSAMDMNSQERVIEGIKWLIPKSTIIFISHNEEVIKKCDQIILLKEGGNLRKLTKEELRKLKA